MIKIKFTPRWKGAIEGHAVNTIRSFYPSLCAEYEFDDLLQEAYIVFMKCKSRYGAVVDNRAWFMVLFSRSLRNFLINLKARCGRYISIEDLEFYDEPVTSPDENLHRRIMQELPDAIKQLIEVFCFGPEKDGWRAYRQLRQAYPDIA